MNDGQTLRFRRAVRADVPVIVQLLANDKLGQLREQYDDPLPDSYYNAFAHLDADPNQELIVVEDEENTVVGTMQLSFIQYLTYRGGIRALIEAVRVRDDRRGEGIGQLLFEWAINRARERNAHLLQLTTDKQRPDAVRFYEKLGFRPTHEGMKLNL